MYKQGDLFTVHVSYADSMWENVSLCSFGLKNKSMSPIFSFIFYLIGYNCPALGIVLAEIITADQMAISCGSFTFAFGLAGLTGGPLSGIRNGPFFDQKKAGNWKYQFE